MRSLAAARLWGLFLLAAGVAVVVAASTIRSQDGWAAVGPRFVPLLVGCALIVLSALYLARPGEPEEAPEFDWLAPLTVVGALVAYLLVLEPLGYVVATTLFFPLCARLLGSRSPLRDAIAGLVLGVVVFVLFTQFLGVDLPAGLAPIT
jgi:putative tricarboxylic transport membrane protein